MTTAKVLKDARHLVEKPERWLRGNLVATMPNGDKCYCALGAINDSAPSVSLLDDARTAFTHAISGKTLPSISYVDRLTQAQKITSFNDSPRTKHKDVLAMFDKAIAEAGNEHA